MEDIDELPEDQGKVIRFWLNNFNDSNADSTTLAHLGHLLKLQEIMDIGLIDATKMDWVAAISNLETERDWTSGTKRNWQKSVRSFLSEHSDAEAKKEEISLAKDDSGGKIKEDDIMSLDEVRVLITEASNRARDQAMFSLLIDLGLRVGALCALRVKDFEHEDGSPVGEISLNDEARGQKGGDGRTHVVTFSAGYIRTYLRSEHPRPDEEDAPLFHQIGQHWNRDDPDADGSINPSAFRRRMRRLADGHGIDDNKLHPHNLKHSAVTIWALRGMSDREIEYRAGWARDSGQLKRYEHLTGDDINDQILDTFGVETETTDSEPVAPISNCPNCSVSVDTGMRYCPQCGQQIDIEMRPGWFEEYIGVYGEDDQLVVALLENPSQIPSEPENLRQSLRTEHQDKIENVVGYSLMGQMPTPDDTETVPVTLPRAGEKEEVTVQIPFGVLTEHGDEDLSVTSTDNGILSLLDADGNVVETVDPIRIV